MSDEPRATASPRYAMAQLQRALDGVQAERDRARRRRAQAKVATWRRVLEGMTDDTLTVGSRTPVADAPAWVTLEVAPGGFATGRFLAESPLRDDEVAVVRSLPAEVPGTTDRERLNLWYLGDVGQAELRAVLSEERYRIDVPEEGALLVVAWLLDHDHHAAALDLVTTLRPLMDRLRFTPRFQPASRPGGPAVRVATAGAVAHALRNARPQPQIAAMNETLRVWHPLFDRLVALWASTVVGELPRLSWNGGDHRRQPQVVGGWPCRRWPADWSERRQSWLADYQKAAQRHRFAGKQGHPKSNFARLRTALERCSVDSRALTARDVGWIRRALANTITKHGAPGSERRAALRATQAAIAARPTLASMGHIVAGRLDRYPAEGGIPALDPIAADVSEDETSGVPSGHPIPRRLVEKAQRALEAPIDELVDRGVVSSGEVLAQVLPQITAQVFAAGFADRELSALYGQIYAAFRRRRSLLLLNLEHQVQFTELPWVEAVQPLRTRRADVTKSARHTLERATLIALSAFPHAILPNALVREFGALAGRAELRLPLVEEVAADIFMGTFTTKWRRASAIAASLMKDTLYARYYDVPDPSTWAVPNSRDAERVTRQRGPETAEDLAMLCKTRAQEAHTGVGGFVAANGAILEQSQILTTHNLAVLVDALDLHARLEGLAPDLADRALSWVVRRQARGIPSRRAQRRMVKNTAYAWRQAIFFLSFCGEAERGDAVARLRAMVAEAGDDVRVRLGPVVQGLAHVLGGGRFDAAGTTQGGGRRFLGWSVGPHWMLPAVDERLDQHSGAKSG